MNNDLASLKRALIDNAVALVTYALNKTPNRRLSSATQVRWGSRGSVVLHISGKARGLWYDFEEREGGDLLHLIRYRILRAASFPDTLRWASEWTNTPEIENPPIEPYVGQEDRAESARALAQEEARRLRKKKRAQAIWHRSKAVHSTPAEEYIRETRKIPLKDWPECLRFDPIQSMLLLKATTASGEFSGIQRVYITPDGRNVKEAETGRNKKLSLGPVGAAAVRLPGTAEGPLLLAEGPESGLSVWCATGYETWIALGSMSKLSPPMDRHVIICWDDDPWIPTGGSERTIRTAKRKWREQGIHVSEAWPWSRRRGDKSDFNDVMKALGPEGVRARIDRVLHQVIVRPEYFELDDARIATRGCVEDFFQCAEIWHSQRNSVERDDTNIVLRASILAALPPVHAIRLTVGGGKTEAALQAILRTLQELRARENTQVIVLAAPLHLLSDEISRRFSEMAHGTGLRAEVWRGREALVARGSSRKMCENIELAREGGALWADMEKEVCPECPFFSDCAYLQQRELDADLWIVAHQMFFHQIPGPIEGRGVYATIIDESIWRAGLIGIDQSAKIEISLDELAPGQVRVPPGKGPDSGERLEDLRDRLRTACLSHPNGPMSREALIREGFDTGSAKKATALEWRRKITSGHWQAREDNRSLSRMLHLWEAVDYLMNCDGPSQSGRISIGMSETLEGVAFRALRVVGRHEIKKAWRVPTLLIDANFDKDLANNYWPEIDKVTDIEIAMPHVRIFQSADRAFSKSMFRTDGKADLRKLRNVRAFVLDVDRRLGGDTLVISNKDIVEGLQLPERIQRAHFNALAGRDEWRSVRSIIILGRPLPPPDTVERIAGALTGEATSSKETGWYTKSDATRHVRVGDDSSLVQLMHCQASSHPDPLAEKIRQQITDGEIIQAIGRGRGVQRTAEVPLTLFVLSDVVLPVPISSTIEAKLAINPSPEARMLAEGGMAFLDAAAAAAAYPQLWATAEAARKAFQRERCGTLSYETLIGCCPAPLRRIEVSYQRAGLGQRPAKAIIDPIMVVDPRESIEWLLGPLAKFEIAPGAIATRSEQTGNSPSKPSVPKVEPSIQPPSSDAYRAVGLFLAHSDLLVLGQTEIPHTSLEQIRASGTHLIRHWATELVELGWEAPTVFGESTASSCAHGLIHFLKGERVRAIGHTHVITESGRVFERTAA